MILLDTILRKRQKANKPIKVSIVGEGKWQKD